MARDGARPAAARPRPAAGVARGSRSCGSSTSRCSKGSTTTAGRSPRTTRSRCRTPTTSTGSSPTRSRCGRSRTTSCSTVGSSARAACGSTAPTCSSGSSRCSASSPKTRSSGSGSCSTRSASARRRTPGSPSASTGFVAILAGEENIREVIAFPKTQSGADPLTERPHADRRHPTPRPRPPPPPEPERPSVDANAPSHRRDTVGASGSTAVERANLMVSQATRSVPRHGCRARVDRRARESAVVARDPATAA